MKVKIGKYASRLTCNIHRNYMHKKYGYEWSVEQSAFEDFIERVDDSIQSVYNVFNRAWFDRRRKTIQVRIDPWDTWSMDDTLAHIILPMLRQLKDTKQGAPGVDNDDVPEGLHSVIHEDEVDDLWFARWDYVLNEMIWAFEQKTTDWEIQFFGAWKEVKGETLGGHFESVDMEGLKAHQARMTNGFKLFGKYYEGLWD